MKTKIIVLTFFACYMNYSQRIVSINKKDKRRL
jgi:hypothetical protein